MARKPRARERGVMTSAQQKESLRYFRAQAKGWEVKSRGSNKTEVNVIAQRNGYVLEVAKERKAKSALDIGCGTGNLVCDLARGRVKAVGVDFAQDMIDIASRRAKKANLKHARFECCSAFDFDFSGRKFDVISANGFIEYISQRQLSRFLGLVRGALPVRGSFVVGSRNRLFNIFSLNAFTRHELGRSAASGLLEEAIALASGASLKALSKHKPVPLQGAGMKHASTGIDVTTRYQYTPLQLIGLLKEHGFRPVEIRPIHIHCAPPGFKKRHPDIHCSTSNLLQAFGKDSPELIPYSSSFMIHARRKGD
ncbi:class I SAM-dependent methyltransferase [Elusimicrobiota bacterium]